MRFLNLKGKKLKNIRPSQIFYFFILFIFCSGGLVKAGEIDSFKSPRVRWESGLNIKICLPSSNGGIDCGHKSMPAKVGKLEKIINVNFKIFQVQLG